MAQDQQRIACPVGVWTQITNSAMTALTFQVLGGPVYIRFTVGATPPSQEFGIVYESMRGESNKLLTDLVKGAGLNQMYAKPVGGSPSAVYIDHA